MLSMIKAPCTQPNKVEVVEKKKKGKAAMAPSDQLLMYMSPKEVMNDPLGALASAALAAEASEASCSDGSKDWMKKESAKKIFVKKTPDTAEENETTKTSQTTGKKDEEAAAVATAAIFFLPDPNEFRADQLRWDGLPWNWPCGISAHRPSSTPASS
mmetsp:Transcript_23357/g.55041  ORF Transcript_23357/g.55041 Transcript_23357/m.55041 type:complete len:157 (-) Transcript_23357:1243-1713(-)